MKIGIIGAGFVGRILGTKAMEVGHQVMISNSRGPHTLFSLSGGIGCEVGTVDEAIAFGEIVIIAIPLLAYKTLPASAFAGKIAIDAVNYYPERDGRIEALDNATTTTSEMLAAHLPAARVVKAFNAVRMIDLDEKPRPKGATDRVALPLAGDDQDAKALVAELYEEFGFDSIDVGPLSAGWRFERDRPAYCTLLGRADLDTALRETVR